jgi:hypothetical protein
MAQSLGRALYKFENVHHRDGNRLNNALSNLELWVTPQPPGQRPEELIPWMISFLETHGFPVAELKAFEAKRHGGSDGAAVLVDRPPPA